METINSKEEKGTCVNNFCLVNRRLLPLKLHYFLLAASIYSFGPYLPLYSKQAGLSSTAIGILYLTVSSLAVIIKPFFGWLADKTYKEKLITIGLLLISIIFYIILSFAPSIPEEQNVMMEFSCLNNDPVMEVTNSTCSLGPERTLFCKIVCTYCKQKNGSFDDCKEQVEYENITTSKRYNIKNSSDITCSVNSTLHCELTCPCDQWCCSSNSKYQTTTFLVFLICFMFVGMAERVLRGLSDSICFYMLKEKVKSFGKQKLWYSLGSCTAPFLGGYILDITREGMKYNYSLGIYFSVALMIVDIITMCKLDLDSTERKRGTTRICGETLHLFFELRHIIFALVVCIGGIMLGFDLVYYNLYMEEIGASKLLIGISIAGSVIVQLPLIYFAGNIIHAIGHLNSLALALGCTAIRFLSFAHIYNPLFVLIPQILLRGWLEFFSVTIASYSKKWAPPGTEATLQQVTTMFYGCLGIGLGYGLGGLGFDYYGSRQTYIITSIVSGTCTLFTFCFSHYIKFQHKKIREKLNHIELEEVNSTVKPLEAESMLRTRKD